MSEPAAFIFVRNGEKKLYADRWAGAMVFRELVWGPEALESWATQFEEIDIEDADFGENILVDFDQKRLCWNAEDDLIEVPAVMALYDRLIRNSWQGYSIDHEYRDPQSQEFDDDEDSFDDRPENVKEAAHQYEDEDDEDEDEDGGMFGETEVRAWVTLIDSKGRVRHRQLDQLSKDLLKPDPKLAKNISALRPAEVPAANYVREGLWFDVGKRTLGIWGGKQVKDKLPEFQKNWRGWNIIWAENGYADQCEHTGATGIPFSEVKALATFIPQTLSTKRVDMNLFLGAIGGGLKKKAMQATGCLLFLICLPLVAFGFFSGNWTAVGWSVLVTFVVVIGLFKFIENRFKRGIKKNLPGQGQPDESNGPPVAGPLDKTEREERLGELLAAAGLPPVDEIRPHFEEDELGLLGLD